MTDNEQRSPYASATAGGPRMHAIVYVDGSGAITLNGATQIIAEPSPDAARARIVAVAVETARQAGRPIQLTSTDPDGQWALTVAPDGDVQVQQLADGQPSLDLVQPGPDETHQREEQLEAPEDEQPPQQPANEATGIGVVGGPANEVEEHHPARALSASSPLTPDNGEPPSAPARAWPDSATAARAAVLTVPSRPGAVRPAAVQTWPPVGNQPPVPVAPPVAVPTLADLLDSRPAPPPGPAEWGWQGGLRRLTFGLVKPQPSAAELAHRRDVATVQRSLAGPRTIVVVNPKGGAHKTTATMLIAATFGQHRGGYTLAWDNNETRGTLGWRAAAARHTNTAVNLLADLERFDDPTRARIGDLDNYVRSQGSAQFDVLASDEDAGASASIEANAFRRLHAALSRFYRIMVIDTGNNMRASNWGAAIEAADQLVIVSTVREDTAASAAWLLDGLRSRLYEDKVAQAVTLLSSPGVQADPQLTHRLHQHFGQLTRAVIDVPYDPALVDGAAIDVSRLQPATREAWLHATAVIADGL